MILREIFSLSNSSVIPQRDRNYHLYSLPAFDNVQTREELCGEEIESAKFVVPRRCILFNKLNVRFKRVWRIDSDDADMLCSTEFLPLLVDETKADFNFCYYLLLTDFITNFLAGQNNNTSGSHKRIDPDLLFSINANLPDKPIQQKIGEYLYSFDQGIAACREVIAAAQKLIASYFDYWFLQYDYPTQEGKPYASSGGKMVRSDSLGRTIPAGWKVKCYGDLVTIGEGNVNPFKLGSTILEHYSIPAYDKEAYPSFDSASDVLSNKFKVAEDSFLVSKLNPQFKRIWDPLCITDNAICSTEFIVCRAIGAENKPLCFAIADSQPFQQFLIQHAASSTGSRKRLNPKDILKYELALPEDDVIIEKFNQICAPCLAAIKEARKEIHAFAEMRDYMLPLLMNQQVTIR